jgi:hypothetical protein
VHKNTYTWGYFVSDSVGPYNSNASNTVGGTAFFKAEGQLLAAPIAEGLADWAKCAPSTLPRLRVFNNYVFTGKNVNITSTLAEVTDTDFFDISSDMLGTINWGDGTPPSFATIVGYPVAFLPDFTISYTAHGWHTYASPGTYHAQITVTDEQTGAPTTGNVTVVVH